MAMYTRRVGRALIVGCLLAMAATTAHAAGEPAPQMIANSLINGWSHDARVISAQYDSSLVRSASSVSVTDKNGDAVGGVTTVASPNDGIDPQRASESKTILVFTPDRTFSDKLAPYTATLTAHALDQDPTIADTVDTFSFKIDTVAPLVPRNLIYGPEPLTAGAPLVVGPTDELSIEGNATDAGKSGVARIEAHFFNPEENARKNPQTTLLAQRFDAVAKAKLNVTCSATCPATTHFKLDDVLGSLELLPGYWTVKVVAVDLAGNVSGESTPVNFLLVSSPA